MSALRRGAPSGFEATIQASKFPLQE